MRRARATSAWFAILPAVILYTVPWLTSTAAAGTGCTESTGLPWTAIGLPKRPSWVEMCAERRLRLLAALPNAEKQALSSATPYIGGTHTGPGLQVGLVLDDGLFYSHGFGFSDPQKMHRPDEETVFRAGSLSKVMTGAALLTLMDDPANHMSLNDDADGQRYLPELKFVCPIWDQSCRRGSQNLGVKLKHLVSHTAGLADVMEQTNANVSPWLSDLKKSWLLFAPGTFGAYSGVGIEGVGLIEQRISGKSYPNFVKDNLFEPLGMMHSTMDPMTLAANQQAQKWLFSASGGSWSFSKFNAIIAGDNQAMILPAGGLATTVYDLSLFIRMWLSGKAPEVNGRSLLKPATLNSADASLFSSTAAGPNYCQAGASDVNKFFYSPCVEAYGFGVAWYVGQKPYLQHNGDEPGLSGSNTVVDQHAFMGATGLISTEPYPKAAGLDSNFISTQVFGLLTTAKVGDVATTWSGAPLAEGTARCFGFQEHNHLQVSEVRSKFPDPFLRFTAILRI
jgi:CubicO group peptidase (beta-lactamase class C family)